MNDKGMPEKVYVGEGAGFEGNDILIADVMDWWIDGVAYIRADIVEELVGVLGWYNDGRDPAASEVMSRIKAIMEGK